ncbi:non-canonical purine NTP pyrophosphatase [Candidatus Pacearchaeota archaeon]|nr:non-canonical purine NTP pyrophosphatase [Candidatus Pacearchaeota archaeon]
MEIYFITGNENKFREFQYFIPDLKRLEIDLPEIQSVNPEEIIKEKIKAALVHKKAGIIVEDTSLFLECLKGLPGPLIKWFMETIGLEGIYELAEKHDNFNAQAKVVIGYSDGENIKFFEGTVRGKIVKPKVKSDFGWDSIFKPDGFDKSFAEMSNEEKNNISMRKIALEKLRDFLES